MGEHARPRISGRHRKASLPARAAAATAVAATGTATAGVIILAGHASAAPGTSAAFHAASQASTITEENVTVHQLNIRLQAHLDHQRHLVHLRHLEQMKQEQAQHVQLGIQVAARVAAPHVFGTYSYGELETLWRSAGGASWAANTAACIAEHESGGNPGAISPTDDFGLWQINGSHGAMASLNPWVNVRSAITISGNGSNWGQWTTAPACGV